MTVTAKQLMEIFNSANHEPTPWFVRRERMKMKAKRIERAADQAFKDGDVDRGERLDEAAFRLSSRW